MSNTVKAKSWLKNFQLAYVKSGGNPVTDWRVCDGAVSEGAPVVLSTGKVAEAATSSGVLYGIALAAGADGDSIPIAVGDRENVFVGQADAATSGIAPPAECDIAITDSKFYVDIGSSTEDVLHVIGKPESDDESDSTDPGRVYFQIKRSSWDALVSAR